MRKDGALAFLHGDHLGSTSLTTDEDGGDAVQQWYYPYGGQRAADGDLPTDYRFTGQRHDSYINLYQMGDRWYNAELGRWISPDPIIPEPGNPQALNRYSYVYNNPVRYTDPTGHYAFEETPDDPVFVWTQPNGGGVRSTWKSVWQKSAPMDARYQPAPKSGGGSSWNPVSAARGAVREAGRKVDRFLWDNVPSAVGVKHTMIGVGFDPLIILGLDAEFNDMTIVYCWRSGEVAIMGEVAGGVRGGFPRGAEVTQGASVFATWGASSIDVIAGLSEYHEVEYGGDIFGYVSAAQTFERDMELQGGKYVPSIDRVSGMEVTTCSYGINVGVNAIPTAVDLSYTYGHGYSWVWPGLIVDLY
ncbi:MAG: RHS repeat-associated core domain-containing protein [Chloroflexi bacterium]|nr:RHS repeat-associated core domain-containing protein [Chloroflexota bacterium]